MALDSNDPKYPTLVIRQGKEAHDEPVNQSIATNVVDYEHPYFTANGAMSIINTARGLANTAEKMLSGKIPDKVFEDISEAARKTKIPYDVLLFAVDWENDLTARSSATDATGIAQKILGYLPELRSSLGRDPMNSELFMAHCVQGAAKVKTILDNSTKKPETVAKSVGTTKDALILKKKRGSKTQPRTNLEVYDFFYKRAGANAKVQFHEDLGKDRYA